MNRTKAYAATHTKRTVVSNAGNPVEIYSGMDSRLAKKLSKDDRRGQSGRWVPGAPKREAQSIAPSE